MCKKSCLMEKGRCSSQTIQEDRPIRQNLPAGINWTALRRVSIAALFVVVDFPPQASGSVNTTAANYCNPSKKVLSRSLRRFHQLT